MNRTLLGYIQLTVAQLGVGMSIVFGKQLMLLQVPVIVQIQLRFVITAAMLIVLAFLMFIATKDKTSFSLKLSGRDYILILLQSLTAGVLFNLLILFGLKYTTATMAGVIASALPAVIVILSLMILGERLSKNKMVAIFLAILGVIVLHLDTVGKETAINPMLGGFLVLLALIPEALYTIFTKLLQGHIHPIIQAICINIISIVLFAPVWWHSGGIPVTAELVQDFTQPSMILLFISGFCSLLFYYCWTAGVSKVPATTAAIFTGLMPISATFGAIMLLGETLTYYDTAGMLFILLSVYIGAKVHRHS